MKKHGGSSKEYQERKSVMMCSEKPIEEMKNYFLAMDNSPEIPKKRRCLYFVPKENLPDALESGLKQL